VNKNDQVSIFGPLIQSGYRTLRFDLYGRGHSAIPLIDYSEHLFVNQTEELIQKLEQKEVLPKNAKFHLFGHSLGGGISITYASQYPQRIRSLLLMAPAGLPFDVPFLASLATVPGISWLVKNTPIGRLILEARIVRAFQKPELFINEQKDLHMQLYYQLKREGFLEAFISTLSHFSGLLSNNMLPAYQKVGKESYPVALFWGKDDHTVPVSCANLAKDAIPRAELYLFEGCGHAPQIEKKEELLKALFEFLNKNKENSNKDGQKTDV